MRALKIAVRENWYRDLWLVVLSVVLLVTVNKISNQSDDLKDAVHGNCIVLGVLLDERADRGKSIKLFAPIRESNPQQFDNLIERAKRGDARLVTAAPDLSCKIAAAVLKRLRQQQSVRDRGHAAANRPGGTP